MPRSSGWPAGISRKVSGVARAIRVGVARGALARETSARLLYGAVVAGGTLAVLASHAGDSARVAIGTVSVLLIYSMADLYVHVVSAQLTGGDTRRLLGRLAAYFREELWVVVGGLPTVAIYLVSVVLGASASQAGTISLTFLVALLFGTGYLGAHRAGMTGGAALLEAIGAGSFGVVIVVLKATLH